MIPMFPLNIIVLPHETTSLYIFEPRYKSLIKDIENENFIFGIPFVKYGKLTKFGTIVMLKDIINKTSTGEMTIQVEGIYPFKIKEFLAVQTHKPYPGAAIDETFNMILLNQSNLKEVIKLYQDYKINIKENAEEIPIQEKINDSYELANLLQLPTDVRLQLISLPEEQQRIKLLSDFMQLAIELHKREKALNKRFFLN